MPWPKGKPRSEETKAKMRAAHARRPGRAQTAATREKLRTARKGHFQVHGLYRHPLYPTWHNMISRCSNPTDRAYPRYGGRGITLCPEWRDVAVFVAWIEANIGPRPEGMSLDRHPDNNGNYEPGNVRWATVKQQNANRRPPKGVLAYARWQALKEWLAEHPEADAAVVLAKMREMEGLVFVVSDETGYFGPSTRSEIEYAVKNGKPVEFANLAAKQRAYELELV